MRLDQTMLRPPPRPGSRVTYPAQPAPRPPESPEAPERWPEPYSTERARLLGRYIGICLFLAPIATVVALARAFFMDLFSAPLTFADALWKIPLSVVAGTVVLFLVRVLGDCVWYLWRTRHQ